MPKGNRGVRKRKPDALKVEIAVRVRQPKGVKIANKVLQQAVAQWLDSGKLPKGITISEMRWQNPSRKSAKLRAWRSTKDPNQTMEDARTTLNVAGWLQSRFEDFDISLKVKNEIRASQNKGKAKSGAGGHRQQKTAKHKTNHAGAKKAGVKR